MLPRVLLASVLAVAAVAVAAPGGAAPAAKAGAAKDWSRTVVITQEGGFRMGNPDAKVKLVEYGSLTCSHCADFANASKAGLIGHVKSGKVSFEFRNYVLNGIDVTASLVARCAPAEHFFPLVEQLYATQSGWVSKISDLPDAEKNLVLALSEGARFIRLGEIGGIIDMGARHGVAPDKARQCLADPAGLERLGAMGEAAVALGVEGTPTFFINGAMAPVNDWPGIDALIRQTGG
jgi:protein-disulfide isomerase